MRKPYLWILFTGTAIFVSVHGYAAQFARIDCYVVEFTKSHSAPVRISCGTDDGIRVGHVLHLVRTRTEWVGKVVVVETGVNEARAKIIELKEGKLPRKGDYVTSHYEGR
jgi:hypothetical protein